MNDRKQHRKMGRPPKPKAEKQGECIMVRVTKAERAHLEAQAKKAGLSLSSLLMQPWRVKENVASKPKK
jgi:predicted HicB family RNase H-like nuclease